MTRKWKRPKFTELNLSAEIGLYQEDYDLPSDDPVRFAAEVPSSYVFEIVKLRETTPKTATPTATSEA